MYSTNPNDSVEFWPERDRNGVELTNHTRTDAHEEGHGLHLAALNLAYIESKM